MCEHAACRPTPEAERARRCGSPAHTAAVRTASRPRRHPPGSPGPPPPDGDGDHATRTCCASCSSHAPCGTQLTTSVSIGIACVLPSSWTPSPPLIDIPSHIIADRNTSQWHSVLKTRVPRKQQAHDHQTHIAATSEGDPRQWVQPRVSGHDESKLLCRARPSARPARRGLRLHLFCGRRFHFLATTRSSVGASSGHQRSKPCRLGGVIDIFTATSGGR